MTDYWKSNERKYCDFCKCWISDNKASISFHENGKRHKLNVSKRITQISRNSAKSEQERQKMDADIRKMEEAAMRSYAQDIHARGDLTARSIHDIIGTSDGPIVGSSASVSAVPAERAHQQIDPMRLPGNSDDEDEGGRVSTTAAKIISHESVPNASLWVEGKSEEGYTYYWNVKTNESVWKAPKEGFLSLAEYERINELALKQQEVQQATEAKHFRENVNEEVARYNREKLKVYRKAATAEEKKAKSELAKSYKTEEEANTQQIGGWEVVQEKPPPVQIDWELPKTNNYYQPPAVSTTMDSLEEPPVKRFKEKTIGKLDEELTCGTSASFKKRKFAAKGNARKRLDDD